MNFLYTKRLYFFLGFTFFLVYAYSLMRLQMNAAEMKIMLADVTHGYEPVDHYYEIDGRTIHYIEIGDSTKPLVILLHGAPSSLGSWSSFFKDDAILAKVKIVAPDRPGYGYSGLGAPEKSVATQVKLLAPILKKYREHHDKILVLGSSYGGPVAAKIAMDYPDFIDGLYLMSASVQPGAEKIYPISYPTNHWSLRWAVPAIFKSANVEKLNHKTALDEIDEGWENITAPTTIFHGDNDNLIYYSNAQYANERLENAKHVEFITVKDGEHGMLWSQNALVKRKFLAAIDRMIYLKNLSLD